ncbi:MAG TPA: hypothetical protein VLB76_03590 [Thermoanaerobaculia bacterium]|jgi:hypothetical protein|nr:hypothetical protein [Thermoanaerobaculia bacterium]
MDKKLRRFLLKPLARRHSASDRKALVAALERLDNRSLGEDILAQLQDLLSEMRNDRKESRWKNLDYVTKSVGLTRALYMSRRISTQEYVLLATSPVEGIHESRITDGHYDSELEPLSKAIDKVREAHGLSTEEYWSIGEGPEEYTRLNRQYSAVLDRHFVKALREFKLDDLANLRGNDPEKFAGLRERGRRSVFHKEEIVPALRDIVVRYEEDARKAASAGAFSAAVTLLGAGIEGLLLLRCLRSKQKSCRVAQKLPSRQRPRSPEDPTKWTFDNLIEVCLRAGWLPPVSTAVADYNSAGLAHLLRLMRNHVHPGKHVRERPWIETDERDYKDAEAIYLILLSTLGHIRSVAK